MIQFLHIEEGPKICTECVLHNLSAKVIAMVRICAMGHSNKCILQLFEGNIGH